eukprot:TRINITY_DN10030_c0_g3_i1.p1 TRINITY_DN10030_c0_g3~~TRINITY_DN10030_c0_g3_i1.p1  ORF type:complete len:382 (+),score=32.33 TRINITY_DN10030_c0_g3_i1:162-1307(+)
MALKLKGVRFNSDGGCFAVATEAGFWIYNSHPTAEITHRDIGGLSLAVMLDRTNIIALVGGGSRPFSSSNTVTIWDDNKRAAVACIESKTPVLNVLLKSNRMVLVLEHTVVVYSFPELIELQRLETLANLTGLAAMTSAATVSLLAIPGLQPGQVHLLDLAQSQPRAPLMFQAHQHALAQLALSSTGRKLASASTRGTIVRVFNARTGDQLCEFRRGLTPAIVAGLVFSRDASLLCACSDRTAHLYHLDQLELNADVAWTAKMGESLLGMKGIAQQYRSFAELELHRPSVCCFAKDNSSLMAIGQHGAAYRYGFGLRGRDASKDKFVTLFKPSYGDMFRLKRTQTCTQPNSTDRQSSPDDESATPVQGTRSATSSSGDETS